MEHDGEPPPRRPGKVILLVLAYWLAGTVLQAGCRWLLEQLGVPNAELATRIGQVLGWGLLVVVSFWYRREIDGWLRV